jgi:predicted nucleotidyltransferase
MQATKTAPTMDEVRALRAEIFRLAQQNNASNIRVFGSVARGDAKPDSDIDFIARFREGTSIFDMVGLWLDLKDLLGREVDLIADHPEGGAVREAALREAVEI